MLEDKTQVFHDQIEAKQKELQPWTAKINTKQAEIDVATSERDTLAKKAAGVKEACKEAQTTLEKLRGEHDNKVWRLTALPGFDIDLVQVTQLGELKEERSTKRQEFEVGQRRLQVGLSYVCPCTCSGFE